MNAKTRFILILCVSAIAIVLLLQFFWVKNYYKVNQETFEKEVNMAFEDALKKEFSLRCDTIQHLIANRLMDTAEFKITGEYNEDKKKYIYTIANAHNPGDKFSSSSFSNKNIKGVLHLNDTIFKREIAESFAYTFRSEDLENHIVYYRTQNLGGFMIDNSQKYDFDTIRLRPVLTNYLKQRDINVPFRFYLRAKDSTLNKSNFNTALKTKYPIITKSYPTYKQKGEQQYVRAMFTNPFSYIISKMGLMFAGSLMVIIMVAFSLLYLLKQLFNEKRLSKIKDDFIGNITHEFKTPIATASAAIEALTDFNVLDDKAKTQKYLNHSKNELVRLSALVDKILNVAIYDTQQFSIAPEWFNVDDLLKKMLYESAAIQQKQINWFYNNLSQVHELYADKTYFEHAIKNVIDNAIKYTPGEVNIQVACSVENGFLAIAVKDNGIGISSEALPRVFEKFYRVSSGDKHFVKGHGLGLSYVKSIIEKHHGWYKAESEYGQGTKLTLAWPV
ncbi:sensor histidine kinase [Mucilaginibacter segetis]|uniref:histidine kinase n=1 Tax=Mucilaginibacter segetis TaxID=2793071 RepID=A0A934PUS4_9SPHI|nr:HAMP domain-containing sensor histidine kinase [Mucilaginibacter segetis]MBK0379977.1 HAMP domain-containing histidine kinase [Mucilaginibacter segetis]